MEALLPHNIFHIEAIRVGPVFMVACAFTAGRFGFMPAVVASCLSFLALEYFYLPPYHSFTFHNLTEAFNGLLFLAATLLISLFTAEGRNDARKVARREAGTQALFDLYRTAAETLTREQALEQLQQRLERMLKADVAFFLPPPLQPERIEPACPPNLTLDERNSQALAACWRDMKTVNTAPAGWHFEPMASMGGPIGVMAVRPRADTPMEVWFARQIGAIADQTASVLERIELERSIGETRIREARDKLRGMLLSSVSHDFKTPLAAIIGGLGICRSLGEKLSADKRDQLIEAALEEAQRLDSFITNILDMTRLETGAVTVRQDWNTPKNIASNAVNRLRARLKDHPVTLAPFPEVEIYADSVLSEQALRNLIDNACKYAPHGSPIDISCRVEEGKGVLIMLRDHGSGLPPDRLTHIFDKYARLEKKDSQVAGTGLGLAIAKAIMDAQGGWVAADNHPEGGAVFTLCFPAYRMPPG